MTIVILRNEVTKNLMPERTNISDNSRRIAKNTVLLYIRMFLMLLVGLYTSRVILNALGQDDYGIYGAVGGVVALFSILTGAIAGAISRFFAFELGKPEGERRLQAVFSTAMTVQLGMALVVLVLAEIAGVWFLNARMNIPPDRLPAANWVLQCAIGAFVLNMWNVPYNAAIIAHERMQAFAYISIVEALMALGVALYVRFTPGDKLKVYALLMLVLAFLIRLLYGVYARRCFPECRLAVRQTNRSLMREMAAFSGWTFLGNGLYVLNTQGVNILMNLFFGVRVNAARDVAVKFEGAVNKFITNFMTALTPQITKTWAAGSLPYMHQLICKGAKYSFFLVWFFALPVFLEAPKLLELWLVNVPEHAVTFVRLSMVSLLIMSLGDPFLRAVNATGKIARYQLVVSLTAVAVFPLTWLAYRSGLAPAASYVIYASINVVMLLERILIACRQVEMPLKQVSKEVLAPVILVAATSLILPEYLYSIQEPSLWRLVEVLAASVAVTAAAIWGVGTTPGERNAILSFIKRKR